MTVIGMSVWHKMPYSPTNFIHFQLMEMNEMNEDHGDEWDTSDQMLEV